ncbi:MAG: class I SAM-dependent methyltransferase [Thermoplasmata archaeon]|nr:MAG: class I SAM-dependent methyltransferase [Thermoplasmata archaeon]
MPPYPDPTGDTFDAIAEAFDASRASPWPFVAEWLSGLGPLATPLVDVGCGNGRHLALAATLGIWGMGVDLSSRLLQLARNRVAPGTGLVAGDARALPVADNVAAAVMAVAMLHHVPSDEDRRAVARELRRIALPGASILVSVWALDDPEVAKRARARVDPEGDGRDLLVPWRAVEGSHVDRYYRVIGLAELADIIAGAGLSVARAWDSGPNHVVQARKVEV